MLDNITRFRESRLIEGFVCPYCHSKAVIRWGPERLPVRQVKISQQLASAGITDAQPTRGLQPYRCKGCGKTSNDPTGTPMVRTKRLDKWEKFTDGMIDRPPAGKRPG